MDTENSSESVSKHLEFGGVSFNYSAHDLQGIKAELDSGKSFIQTLKRYGYDFGFDPKFMESLLKDVNVMRSLSLQRAIIITLRSYLSLMIDNSKQQDQKSILLLMKVINFLFSFDYSSKEQRISQILVSTFVHTFNTYIGQSRVEDHPHFLPIISEFFSRVRNPPVEAYDLFVLVGRKLIDPNQKVMTKFGSDLVAYIDSVVTEVGDAFPAEVAKSIVQMLVDPISVLDMCSLMLFSHAAPLIGSDCLSYVPLLPLAIVGDIESQPPTTPYSKGTNEYMRLEEMSHFALSMSHVTHTTFAEEIDLTAKIEFPEKRPLTEMIRPDIVMKLQVILKTIAGNRDLCENFMNLCPKFVDSTMHIEYAYDILAAFFYVFDQLLQSPVPLETPLEVLCHEALFDPAITLFGKRDQNWEKVNTLRAMAIDFLVCNGVTGFRYALNRLMRTPLIFTEVMHRFSQVQNCLVIERTEIPTISQTLMMAMITFQQLKDLSDENAKMISNARKSIFRFLNDAFTQPELLKIFWADPFFIESFLTLLFEAPVRTAVLSPMLKYMAMKDAHENESLVDKIIQIFDIAAESFHQEESVGLANDLLGLINEIVMFNIEFAKCFECLTVKFTKGVLAMQKSTASENFLVQYITFLSEASPIHSVDTPEIAALEKGIENVFGSEPPKSLFVKLVQLIAGQQLPSLHPSFIIRQPKAAKLLVGIFKKSVLIKEVFGFIAALCQHDTENSIQAHNGELDLLLIGMLQQWKTDDSISVVVVASAFSLLTLIMNVVSSATVVQSFVALLCQTEGRYLPSFHKLTLKVMNNMLFTARQKPRAFLPLLSDTQIDFHGLKGEHLEQGFTVAFWVYTQNYPPQYKAQIVSVLDSKHQGFSVSIQGCKLMISVSVQPSKHVGKPELEIPAEKWTFVTVKFMNDSKKNKTVVSLTVDGEEDRDLNFPMLRLPLGTLNAKLGGTVTSSEDVPNPAQLGPIGIFKTLDYQYIPSIITEGAVSTSIVQYKPIFYFMPKEQDGRIVIRNVADGSVEAANVSIQIKRPLTFTEVLANHCGIDILLPVFAQWDLKFKNGEVFQYLPETTIELFENALLISEDAQQRFAESGGLKVVHHLLMSVDEKHMTYQLYQRWYSSYCLMKNELLQEEMFDLILVNPHLWMRCDAENHRRIVRHWARVLVPSCKEMTLKKRPFTWFISIMRMYYWYKPIETGVVMLPKRACGQALNVNECRGYLLSMANFVIKDKFTKTDFKCLMSHILTCGDHMQNVDLLIFLKNLITEKKDLLVTMRDSTSLMSMLQYLFNIRNESVVASTLNTIVDAHKSQLIDHMNLETHLDIILHQLTADFVSKSLLGKLIEITETTCPELFPICSWMAMNIGNKGMRAMLTGLTPSSRLCTNHFWAIWIVVALYKADEKLQRFISRFLIRCSTDNFPVMFATIDVVGRVLSENAEMIKIIVLTEFGKLLLRDDYQPHINDIVGYFSLLKHHLLFRSYIPSSEALASIAAKFEEEDGPRTPRKTRMTARSPRRSPRRSPKKEEKRKARHSLHRNSLICITSPEDRYSPELAEQALSFLNPEHPTNERGKKPSFRSKRTSLMVLKQKSFEYEPRPSIDIKIISMMPSEMDAKISEISHEEFAFRFGLRLDKNADWLDKQLAEQALEVFKKSPDTRCAETVLLILSFMLHYNKELVKSVLPMINMNSTSLSNVISLFRHHADIVGFAKKKDGDDLAAFQYMQNIETPVERNISAGPLRFLKRILKFQEDNSLSAFDVFGMINEEIISMSSNFMAEYTDKQGELATTSSKRWSTCWNHLTTDHAPWRRSLPRSAIHELHFKRDFSRCPSYCPVKLRRNFQFDDHLKASLIRDTGNSVSAEARMQQLRDELAAQYTEDAPPSLFEVTEDKERVHRTESHSGAQCIVELPCEVITVRRVREGSFSLMTDMIILTLESKTIMINLEEIVEAFTRTRFHHPTAIELFLHSGKSYFINFPNIKSAPVLKSLKGLHTPRLRVLQCDDFKSYIAGSGFTEAWASRKMSNFEYLMRLNIASGRSFNDPSQYPILPWILNDYTSETLNLEDSSIYRNLGVPIGATSEERIAALREKAEQFDSMGMDPYLYSSGYVCPLSVYLWLIREEPFTSLHIDIQSGRFDHAARQFSSIKSAFVLSTSHQNDFRELIPEFFTTPEFLVNRDNFDLGQVQGESISHVALPPWAKTAFDFVYMQRKALESDYVSAHLQEWVDLVWGEKARGEKARNADNVFMEQMYDSIWTEKNLKNPEIRAEIEAILCHVGQVPPQLFEKPHPKRLVKTPTVCAIQRPISTKLQVSNIMAANITAESERKVKISVIDESGQAIVTRFNVVNLGKTTMPPSKGRSASTPDTRHYHKRRSGGDKLTNAPIDFTLNSDNLVSSKSLKQFDLIKPASKTIIAPLNGDEFITVGSTSTEVFKIRPSSANSELITRQKSDVTCMASDGEWIAIANQDAMLNIYRQDNMKQVAVSIPCYTSSVRCCAISQEFHAIVCGTRKGSLLLCSLDDGSIVRIIDLNDCRPSSVLITKGWGFIVVYMTKIQDGKLTHHMSIYSINGDLIRTVDLESGVTSWSTYKSVDGFDFIIMAAENGNLYHFEAYFLDIGTPLYGTRSNVIATSFLEEGDTAIAVTDDGKVFFLPYDD